MRLDLTLQFHPGVSSNPRPSLKITAKALRREDRGGYIEEFVHSRMVDCPYPSTLAIGMHRGLEEMQKLRTQRNPLWHELSDEDWTRAGAS